jgi:hypothetical protein
MAAPPQPQAVEAEEEMACAASQPLPGRMKSRSWHLPQNAGDVGQHFFQNKSYLKRRWRRARLMMRN